jgi:hypothetical protein
MQCVLTIAKNMYQGRDWETDSLSYGQVPNSPFMKPKLPSSEDSATGPYPEPDQSRPHPHPLLP